MRPEPSGMFCTFESIRTILLFYFSLCKKLFLLLFDNLKGERCYRYLTRNWTILTLDYSQFTHPKSFCEYPPASNLKMQHLSCYWKDGAVFCKNQIETILKNIFYNQSLGNFQAGELRHQGARLVYGLQSYWVWQCQWSSKWIFHGYLWFCRWLRTGM